MARLTVSETIRILFSNKGRGMKVWLWDVELHILSIVSEYRVERDTENPGEDEWQGAKWPKFH